MTAGIQGKLATELVDLVRKEHGRIERRRKTRKALKVISVLILGQAMRTLMNGWLFMLAVDAVHSYWIRSCPTIGYWWAVWIGFLLAGCLPWSSRDKAADK